MVRRTYLSAPGRDHLKHGHLQHHQHDRGSGFIILVTNNRRVLISTSIMGKLSDQVA